MSTTELSEYIDELAEKNPFLKKEFESKTSYETEQYTPKTIVHEENPRLSLISNLRTLKLTEEVLKIAEHLIYELDDNGYLKIDLEEVARDLVVPLEKVEGILSIIQDMDPPGIGARDVRECLKLQLKRRGKENSIEYEIVTGFMGELANSDAKKISSAMGLDEARVIKAIENIKKLNPRPASTLLSKQAERVVPDLVARMKNKKLRLELNREWMPRLRLYNPYENKLDVIKDSEVKQFLKENMEAGKQLIDNIKRREETMCRVADHILKFQKESFGNGFSCIRHLTIKDVAEELNYHPSTISRTVSNKYIQIDDKVIPLKTLLSHSIKKQNGDLVSKTTVKNRIKELAKSEDKTAPLSDSAIKKKLEAEGIFIKRRTVAKYRDSLRILPVHLRRNKQAKVT